MSEKKSVAGIGVIRFLIFAATFAVGTQAIYWDFAVELHEIGHLEGYAQDGVKAWRSEWNEVTSDHYTRNGVLGGYTKVFHAGFIAFFILFFLSCGQYYLLGLPMGFTTAYYFWAFEGSDLYLSFPGSGDLYGYWEGNIIIVIIMYALFIIWKAIPEIRFLKDGFRTPIIFKDWQ